MVRSKPDKSPAEIRFLLNCRGLTFADVERRFGLPDGTGRNASRRPYHAAEMAIAEALELPPCQIWPSRYDPKTGERLSPQPKGNYTNPPRLRTSQKGDAA
jgi:lambda repressor-like predicted transcriptional regulator